MVSVLPLTVTISILVTVSDGISGLLHLSLACLTLEVVEPAKLESCLGAIDFCALKEPHKHKIDLKNSKHIKTMLGSNSFEQA